MPRYTDAPSFCGSNNRGGKVHGIEWDGCSQGGRSLAAKNKREGENKRERREGRIEIGREEGRKKRRNKGGRQRRKK